MLDIRITPDASSVKPPAGVRLLNGVFLVELLRDGNAHEIYLQVKS